MANLLLPDVVGSVQRGQQAAQENELRALQLNQARDTQARDAQFRNELAAYLQGGSNGLAGLIQADPERALQFQQYQEQRAQAEHQQMIDQAKQVYASANAVINSASPAARLKFLHLPATEQWASQTGKSPDSMTDQDAINLAQEIRDQAAVFAGIEPEKTEPFTLSEGQVRFDSSGKQVASVPKAPSTDDALKREQQIFDRANTLRDEYDNQSKDFRGATDAYQRVLSSSADPSPAGDLALIFSYMRTLDPASSVREGEFANAENAGSIPSRIWAKYNKVLSGERLSPEQRNDFIKKAGELYQGQKDLDKKRREKYSKLATRNKINPADVIGDDISIDVPANALGIGQTTSVGGFKVTRKK